MEAQLTESAAPLLIIRNRYAMLSSWAGTQVVDQLKEERLPFSQSKQHVVLGKYCNAMHLRNERLQMLRIRDLSIHRHPPRPQAQARFCVHFPPPRPATLYFIGFFRPPPTAPPFPAVFGPFCPTLPSALPDQAPVLPPGPPPSLLPSLLHPLCSFTWLVSGKPRRAA